MRIRRRKVKHISGNTPPNRTNIRPSMASRAVEALNSRRFVAALPAFPIHELYPRQRETELGRGAVGIEFDHWRQLLIRTALPLQQ